MSLAETTTSQPDSAVMRGVIPYLNLAGRAGEAADFYMRGFGATDLGRVPHADRPGRYMHVQLAIHGGCLMMTDHECGTDEGPNRLGGHLQLVVEDGRAWWDRAVAAGCAVVAPYETQFWGDRWGMLEDPFGVLWAVMQPSVAGI